MTTSAHNETEGRPGERPLKLELEMPAPTAWPLVLAFGITLAIAGLVTNALVSVVGIALSLAGGVGWFRQVLPRECRETMAVRDDLIVIATTRPEVERIAEAPELRRMSFPATFYPVKAGIEGGLAGGVAMAVVAMINGWISHASIWYPVNLLGAVVYANALQLSTAKLAQFSLVLLLVALVIHVTTSVLVGLLYGTMLPMLPRHPIVLGGVIAPLLWSGLVYGALVLVNPLLDARIDWAWFMASQVAFGCVAGWVVDRYTPLRARQLLPLEARAGISGTGTPTDGEKGERH